MDVQCIGTLYLYGLIVYEFSIMSACSFVCDLIKIHRFYNSQKDRAPFLIKIYLRGAVDHIELVMIEGHKHHAASAGQDTVCCLKRCLYHACVSAGKPYLVSEYIETDILVVAEVIVPKFTAKGQFLDVRIVPAGKYYKTAILLHADAACYKFISASGPSESEFIVGLCVANFSPGIRK